VEQTSPGCLAPSQRAYYIDIIGHYVSFDFTNVVNGRFFAVNGNDVATKPNKKEKNRSPEPELRAEK
jgi:hypothetical protein